MATRSDNPSMTPEEQLRSFLAQYGTATQKLVKTLRAALRKRFPTAHELAYDYGSQVVIAYGPTERGIEAIISIVAREDGVQLHFNNGPRLPDPKKLLKGKAKMTRYIEVESAGELADPDVDALIRAAVAAAKVPLPTSGKGTLSVRGKAAKG